MKKVNSLLGEIQRISTSREWKRDIREWARLSRGLRGKLARKAREVVRKDRLAGFSTRERPLLNRLVELETTIQQQAN